MLARVADSLYWTGRYIERSEHLARYLKVQYFTILDAPMSQNKDFVFKSILNMYGIEYDSQSEVDEQEVLFEVGLSPSNNVSILSTIAAARENARTFRYLISTELWEVINQYYLFAKEYDPTFFTTRGLYDFTVNSTKHCAIVRSYLDHTVVHDSIWMFIKLGIRLERVIQIIRILKSKLNDIEALTENGFNQPLKQYQWTTTLKVLEGFDMHRRVYRKIPKQRSTFEFLVTNPIFPRSIAYNFRKVDELVTKLCAQYDSEALLKFKAGKLAHYFKFLEYEEIKDDLPGFLDESLNKVYALHDRIGETFFT